MQPLEKGFDLLRVKLIRCNVLVYCLFGKGTKLFIAHLGACRTDYPGIADDLAV